MAYERLNKKGETLIRSWVIGILIFSGIFALLFLSSADLFTTYDADDLIDENYRDNYDKFDGASEDYRGLFTEMSDDDSGVLDIIFGETGVFRAFFDIIKITFSSVSILDDITSQFVQDFGVPEAIANVVFPILSAILMIFLIFSIISSINRGSKI